MKPDTRNIDNQQYQGTGKLVSALGGFGAYGFIPNLVASVLMHTRGLGKLTIGAAIIGFGSSIYGAFRSWNKAGEGEAQFNALKSANSQEATRNEGLQTQVEGLNREVEGHRKYADSIRPRAKHGSHAAAHEAQTSGAEHESVAR